MSTSTPITSSRTLSYVALFAALIAALGAVPRIDLALGVPITLQTLGVMLAGCLLGPRRGFLAVALLLVGVALGLPLLSGGRGGPGAFVTPSAGFLVGWLFGAFVCGWVMRRFAAARGRTLFAAALAASFIGGIVVVYLFGIAGLSLVAHLPLQKAALASLVFVPGDLVKCVVCALVVQTVARGLPSWRLDRD